MSYLVQQLWATLLIAFGIGAIFGWLLKSWWALRLHSALRDAGARHAALQGELGKSREELKSSKERLCSAELEVQTLRSAAQLAGANEATSNADHAGQLDLLKAQLQVSLARIDALEVQHVEAGAALAARMGEAASLRVELERQHARLKQEQVERSAAQRGEQKAREIASALEVQKSQLARALTEAQHLNEAPRNDPDENAAVRLARQQQAIAEAQAQQLRMQLERCETELAQLKQMLPTAQPLKESPASPSAANTALPADNLQDIRGVGPKIAARLRELGVFTYSQIARADRAELARLAAALPGFAGRIDREDWAGQCVQLHRQKYGAAP